MRHSYKYREYKCRDYERIRNITSTFKDKKGEK